MAINADLLRLEMTRQAYTRDPGTSMHNFAETYYKGLGYPTANACRSAVLRLQKKAALTVPVEFECNPIMAPSFKELRTIIATQRQKLDKAEALGSIFETVCQEALQAVDPIPFVAPKPAPGKKPRLSEFCQLMISDMQTGSFITKEATAGLSSFSMDVLHREVETWKKNVMDVLAVKRGVVHVPRCNVCLGGDMVEGEDIYNLQLAELDERLLEQVIRTAYILVDMMLMLASTFEQVDIYAVEGNHGKTRTTTLNLDSMVYFVVDLLLKKQPNIRMFWSRSPFLMWAEPGSGNKNVWTFLLSHGREIQAWNRIPYYGLDRARQEWNDLVGTVIDTVFVGHHHRYAEIEGNRFMNGTWVPGTSYSVGKMRAASRPIQLMMFHNPEIGWTSRWPIYLGEKPQLALPPSGQGIMTPYREGAQVIIPADLWEDEKT